VNIKSVVVYITKTGEKYHRDGCKSLSKSKIPSTVEEAKEKGLTPCAICKP
jgi:competence protein ComEC